MRCSDTHSSATTRRKKVAEDDDAGMEHVRDSLPYSLSYDEIERRFGVGTRVYWCARASLGSPLALHLKRKRCESALGA